MTLTDSGIRTVLVTVPDADVGAEIARVLVDSKLAACVNIVPGVRSIYRWRGEMQDDVEALLIVKTAANRCVELTSCIQTMHPYEVPEVLELPATSGSERYLAWVVAETNP